MPAEFYIAIDGVQDGPISEEEVRRRMLAGGLRGDDHCWTEGWDDWRPIESVFVFNEPDFADPTVLQPDASGPEASSASRPLPPHRLPLRRDQTSSGIFVISMALVIAIALGGAGWYVFGGRDMLLRAPAGDESAGIRAPGKSGSVTDQGPTQPAPTIPLRPRNFAGHNLEQIAQACVAYAQARGGKWPAYVSQLEPLFGDRFAAVMDVPETPEVEGRGYVIRMGLSLDLPADTPIAFEARPRPDGSRGVAYLNGRMRVLRRGDPELARALER